MLTQAIVLLLAAVVLVPLCTRLALGAVTGYLLAGLLVGPGVLRLVDDVESVLHISELGVVFLLFVIGLELRPSRLWLLREQVFVHGTAQVVATATALGAIAMLLGLTWQAALVVGVGLAMSSTALVLQTLAEKNQLTARHGREAFAILLFQDLAVIPLLAIMPLLGTSADAGQPGWQSALRAGLIIVAAVVSSRLLIRPLLRVIVTFGGREIFTASALLVVVGSALLMVWAGLSMSLGAFLAGVLLADSEYRHELEAVIEPFKGLLLGLFFMAVGMTVNLPLLTHEPLLIGGLVLALVGVKAGVLFSLRYVFKAPTDSARKLALALAQGGEFAFVLFNIAVGYSIVDRATSDLLILVVTLSMLVAPLLFLLEDKVFARWWAEEAAPFSDYEPVKDHGSTVIIVGFGRVGQVVARILNTRKITFTALEKNPQQIDFVRKFGNQVYYGDATRLDLLMAAGLAHAKLFVLTVGNIDASLEIAASVRKHYPKLPIYARAHNRAHAYKLMDIGVKMLVRETLYSSIELSRGVLHELGYSAGDADRTVTAFLEFDEKLLRQQHVVQGDEQQLIAASKQANDELRALFEAENTVAQQAASGAESSQMA
jgi:glutathione-regulated potassium-efflux system ancillary protein KefC/glutathione-regulated potassium-efflux system protein KefB